MKRSATQSAPDVVVESRDELPREYSDYARTKIAALERATREPILYARVRLDQAPNPAVPRPAIAQANLDVNGRLVRAQVAGSDMYEAIDLLQERLRRRLVRLAQHWEARRGGVPLKQPLEPHEWRHGSEPTHRPDYFPRPPEERRIVRRKSFTLEEETPDEAAFDMEMMGYDFHLFTDTETGQDSVLYRKDGGYRLAQPEPRLQRTDPVAVPLTISKHPAPRLSVDEAVERLNLTGLPFVFFVNSETGRGNVLYHRYDGHYGLITPATS